VFLPPQFTNFDYIAGGRRHIPRSVKEQLVVMSGYMRPSQIARVTHINIRTVQSVLALGNDWSHTAHRRRVAKGSNIAFNSHKLDLFVR
jgi:hypothetical protein